MNFGKRDRERNSGAENVDPALVDWEVLHRNTRTDIANGQVDQYSSYGGVPNTQDLASERVVAEIDGALFPIALGLFCTIEWGLSVSIYPWNKVFCNGKLSILFRVE